MNEDLIPDSAEVLAQLHAYEQQVIAGGTLHAFERIIVSQQIIHLTHSGHDTAEHKRVAQRIADMLIAREPAHE